MIATIVLSVVALVLAAALAGIVFGGWLVNNAYKADAEQGNAVLIGGKIYELKEVKNESVCPDCGHSLVDNNHGPDQNDYEYDMENDTFIYVGSCTYCKYCNPALTPIEANNKEASNG